MGGMDGWMGWTDGWDGHHRSTVDRYGLLREPSVLKTKEDRATYQMDFGRLRWAIF